MKKIALGVLVFSLAGFGLMAQQTMNFEDYMQLVRSDLRTAAKALITENMGFTEKESAAFWPVYTNFERDQTAINDELQKLIKDYSAAYNAGNVPDKTAEDLLQRSMKVQKDKIALQEKYLPELRKILPVVKVARFMQIQNKLQAAINLKLAAEIPLIK